MQSRYINYLEMSVQFSPSLLTAEEVSKLVIVPMKSHSYCGCLLFMTYQMSVQ